MITSAVKICYFRFFFKLVMRIFFNNYVCLAVYMHYCIMWDTGELAASPIKCRKEKKTFV